MISTPLVNVCAKFDTNEFLGLFSVSSNFEGDFYHSDDKDISVVHRLTKNDFVEMESIIAKSLTDYFQKKMNTRKLEYMLDISDEEKLSLLKKAFPDQIIKSLDWKPFCQKCSVSFLTTNMIRKRYGYRCTHCSNTVGWDMTQIVVPQTSGIDLTQKEN